METMEVRIENGKLTIELPVNSPPKKSSTGKTMLLATTGPKKRTEIFIDGRRVYLAATAYFFPKPEIPKWEPKEAKEKTENKESTQPQEDSNGCKKSTRQQRLK